MQRYRNSLVLLCGIKFFFDHTIKRPWPFVLGRNYWLFAGSPRGAEASATFFTLIETAKANGLEPYSYLRYLFEKLPFAQSESDYLKLLPNRVEMAAITEHAAAWV